MSLTIFTAREDVPNSMLIVDNNDLYFEAMSKIPDSEEAREILANVDGAVRVSDRTFKGKFTGDGAIYASCLSTGCKTLLNILQHREVCINLLECGTNALRLLPLFKDGYVLWPHNGLSYQGTTECNIVVNDKHFTDFKTAILYLYYGEDITDAEFET